MPDPALAASLLAGVLAVFGLLTAPFERRLYGSDRGTPRKLLAYGLIIVLEWALTAVAVWISGWAVLLQSPAATSTWFPAPAIVGPALGALTAVFIGLSLFQLLRSLRGLRQRQAYGAAIRRAYGALPGLLPNTAVERAAWVLLSLTAGLCEEVLYRGFLIRFLHEGALALPVAGALAASALAFGLGHAYQGFKGVLSTTVAGLIFGLLFLLSGSLIPGIIVHVLVDAQLAYVLRPLPGDAPAGLEAA